MIIGYYKPNDAANQVEELAEGARVLAEQDGKVVSVPTSKLAELVLATLPSAEGENF